MGFQRFTEDGTLITETFLRQWPSEKGHLVIEQGTAYPLPAGAITSQPVPDGQTQRFVGTATDATSGTYSITGSNGGVTKFGSFAVTAGAFDFTITQIVGGDYLPTLTLVGPGGASSVSGTSSFSIVNVTGGTGAAEPPAYTVSGVTVTPATVTLNGNATQQFIANVLGTNNPPQTVVWSTDAGATINSSGLFTAPSAQATEQTFTVTATSQVDPTKAGTAIVTVAALVVPQNRSITVTLVDSPTNNTPMSSLTDLKWAVFNQTTPDLFTAPIATGSAETTDESGNLVIDLTDLGLTVGTIVWLIVTNSNGNPTVPWREFSGPLLVE